MTQMAQLPELTDFMLKTGLSISGISRATKVSRNTLAAIRDGSPVRLNSLTKLLSGLEEAQYDVVELRRIVQRRIDSTSTKMVANSGTISVIEGGRNLRNTDKIASELRENMRNCESLVEELLDSIERGDYDVKPEDPRNIWRLEQKIKVDLGEVYTLLGVKRETPS